MIGKEVIALDIDDVLSGSMESVRREVNERLGINLQPEHYSIPGTYWDYYEMVWAQHGLAIGFDDLDEQSVKSRYVPITGARQALEKLAMHYKLVAITSRKEEWKGMTLDWLDENFPGVIDSVIFAGNKEHSVIRTKGEVCTELGAKWLIDDNVEHAEGALGHGITAVLFGDYGWHKGIDIHKDIVRCKDWAAVLEYFDGIA